MTRRARFAEVVLAVRTDWPHRIAPPRLIVGIVIGGIGVIGGLVLQLQPASWTVGPTFFQMVRWGSDCGFRSHPMTLWALALGVPSAGTLLALRGLRPVIAGVFVLFQTMALGLYTAGAWYALSLPQPRATPPDMPHAHSTVFAPLMLSGLALWWSLTAGALLSVRPGKPWPFR